MSQASMTKMWERYATRQGYATMVAGRSSGSAAALQMSQSVLGLTGSGVLLGEPEPVAYAPAAECEGYTCSVFEL